MLFNFAKIVERFLLNSSFVVFTISEMDIVPE